MTIVLARIDDRLVHGQVVIGWGRPLRVEFIVVVDDIVAAAEWEQDIYRSAVPDSMEVVFSPTDLAAEGLQRWQDDPRRGILITSDVATMARLQELAPGLLSVVNLGGVHHRPGREEKLSYVFLDRTEEELVARMAAHGVRITAQDLPTSAAVDARALVR